MKRVLAQHGELTKYFGHENGKQYIGFKQDADQLLDHVRFLNDKVNGAASRTNINKWRYKGTIPTQLVVNWCTQNGYTFNDFACNTDNAKTKFLKWFQSEYPKLLPAQHAAATPKIIVPSTYQPRKNAAAEGNSND